MQLVLPPGSKGVLAILPGCVCWHQNTGLSPGGGCAWVGRSVCLCVRGRPFCCCLRGLH